MKKQVLNLLLILLLGCGVAFGQGSQVARPIPRVTSLPATCTIGDKVILISGGVAADYICSTTNTWMGSGAGTVTSVALTAPSWLTVSNSPVINTGTLAITAATGQTAGRILGTPAGATGAVDLVQVSNGHVAASAAIAYSKLNLTGAILNADLAGSIAISKLSITGTPNGLKFLRDDGSWQTAGSVDSVFGRDGAVVATQDDYTFAQLASKPTTLAGYGITDAQGIDADLTALAGLNATAGLVEQTGAAAFTKRLIGVANAADIPTRADADTRYSPLAGSTSIVTLGTIAAGTWNAAVIGSAYGGAGTVSGLLKANGSGTVSAAVSATDYAPATTGSSILKASSGGFANAAAGTDYVAPGVITGSGLTMTTARVLGRTTASTGAIEELPMTGTGSVALSASPTFTGTMLGENAAFTATPTTGNGVAVSSSTVTSGNIVSITGTSTAATSSTMKGLNIALSGVNGTTAQTVTGQAISVTNTNVTSGTNIGLNLTASGATTQNTALNISGGDIRAAQTQLSYTFTGGSTPSVSGMGYTGGHLVVSYNNTGLLAMTAGGGINFVKLPAAAQLGFSSANFNDSLDTILRRKGVANFAFGATGNDLNSGIVAQTLSVEGVLVGGTSNQAGKDFTIQGSQSKGTGAGGSIIFQTTPAGSSGTTLNSFVTALTIQSDGVVVYKSVAFAALPTVVNGGIIYCSDCTVASPCASGGSGALAKGINSQWVCN